SALGMLLSDSICDVSHTLLVPVKQLDAAALTREVERLSLEARMRLRDDGFRDDQIEIEPAVDVRYRGQAYEITVPFSPTAATLQHDGDAWSFVPAFHAAHERMYGYADPNRPVELVNIRVRGAGRTPKPSLLECAPSGRRGGARPVAERVVFATGKACRAG